MSKNNARYQRSVSPPPMRFQDRDGQILATLHRCDGVLARRQIRALFWPQASTQALERRLALLYHNAYLNWPSAAQRRTQPTTNPAPRVLPARQNPQFPGCLVSSQPQSAAEIRQHRRRSFAQRETHQPTGNAHTLGSLRVCGRRLRRRHAPAGDLPHRRQPKVISN